MTGESTSNRKQTQRGHAPKRRLNFETVTTSNANEDKAPENEATIPSLWSNARRNSDDDGGASSGGSGRDISTTPQKKRTKRPIVTPGDDEEEEQKPSVAEAVKEESSFLPVYLHKNLSYSTKGKAADSLPSTTVRAFDLICETHTIPSDLEQSRVYGPLSGSCYQDKVLQAYMLRQLQPKKEWKDHPTATQICIACAEQGHIRDDCPTLLL